MWKCANAHAVEYLRGDYRSSAMLFQRHLNYYKDIWRWDLFVVLDGVDPPEKG
jgi:hypothetical protein